MSDFSRASWRLKIERAKHHLVELEAKISAYGDRKPYEIRRERERGAKHNRRFVLHFTEKPDPEIAIVMGDVIHNLRSALDHLAVAVAPRNRQSKASFPIFASDPWATNADGGYVDAKARDRFEHAVKDMPADAVAFLKELQPYANPSRWPALRETLRLKDTRLGYRFEYPDTHMLTVLSRLENNDKHCRLVAVVGGLEQAVCTATFDGRSLGEENIFPLCADGATVYRTGYPIPVPRPEPEVQVEIRGTVQVAVRIRKPEGNVAAVALLRSLSERLPLVVFPFLENFARP